MDSANCYAFCPVGPLCPSGRAFTQIVAVVVLRSPMSVFDYHCQYATNDAARMLFHVSTGRDRTAPRFVGWLSERLHASTNTVPVGQRSLLFAATKNGGTRCA